MKSTDSKDVLIWISSVIDSIEDVYTRKDIKTSEMSDRIYDDLGIDSLGLVNLFYGIVDELGLDHDESRIDSWKTLDDIVQYVKDQAKD